MEILEDAAKLEPDLAALMADARKAFNGISRQGFAVEGLDESTVIDGFAVGVTALLSIKKHLANFHRALEKARLPHVDWTGQFDADKAVFLKQFRVLYEGN